MSDLDKARLAQFWHARVAPLLGSERTDDWPESLYEASGWLNEGVFCGYFDRHEADFAWIVIRNTVGRFPDVSLSRVSDSLEQTVRTLEQTDNPFREAKLMPDGNQRNFEEPLMWYALLLSNRFATDPLASACTRALLFSSGSGWESLMAEGAVPSEICTALATEARAGARLVEVLAGYYRMLEHMDASRRLFEYARVRAKAHGADFESYQERLGALNAWRVPLMSDKGRARFNQIGARFDEVLLHAVSETGDGVTGDGLEEELPKRRDLLNAAWSEYHFAAFLAYR